jgi:nucleotide-binding universal stress UspA family protein
MIKDLVAYLATDASEDPARNYALSIAEIFGAHVTGFTSAIQPIIPGPVVGGVGADFIGSVIAENQRAAKARLDRFEEAANKLGLQTSKRQISATLADSASSFAKLASCCDLSVIAQSGPDSYGANDLAIEGALFRSGRPAIVVPYIHKLPISLKRTICCWDGSPSAARAIADAVPLLKKADRVELLIVVTEKIKDDEIIGADMAEHLARLGLNVTLQRINAADIDVGNAILSHVADSGSEFLVMGGYGHSRLREFVLGGATRTILSSMTVPVLISH